MKRYLPLYFAIALMGVPFTIPSVSAFVPRSSIQDQAPKPEQWVGEINVGAMLRLVLNVTRAADGTLKATLDSIDQGAMGLPIDSIEIKDGAIVFEMKQFSARYEGKLNADGTEMTGTWKQGPGSLPLTFKKSAAVPVLNRPQTPKPPFPYETEEVAYDNKAAGIKLAGTLTLPRTKGPHPAVLLITGSGAQDRDETLFQHKPFLVIADYLTKRGVAVLRVDDRGVGGSGKGTPNDTSADYAGDVLAGVDFLKSRKDIDSKKIGLMGHSEGGMIAPMVAVKSKDVAFIVLLAGPGQKGSDLLADQVFLIMKAAGMPVPVLEKDREFRRRLFTLAASEKDAETARTKMTEALKEYAASLTEMQRAAFGMTPEGIDSAVKQFSAPWMRFFLAYDPTPTLKQVHCPVLALNGENDLQVPCTANLPLIEAALKAGGNKNGTFIALPKLNHLFQTSETGAPTEYSKIEETFSPAVLETIGNWITARTNAK